MQTAGFSIIRFWNVDVVTDMTAACGTILAALDGKLTEDVTATDLRFVKSKNPLTGRFAATFPPLRRGEETESE